MVTGVAGFIGFHVANRLLKEGYNVIGIDNLSDYYDVTLKQARLNILETSTSFKFYRVDLSDEDFLGDVFQTERIDRTVPVIHLAAQAGVRYGLINPRSYIRSNILAFFNLIENCRIAHVPHLLYASSSSVYGGNRSLPFSIHDNVDHPISLYAATKKSNELFAHNYSYSYGIPTTGLRFFTVYGPWGRPDMALFQFTKAILAGNKIEVFNNGDMCRDFTYIDDIVDGIVGLVDLPPVSNLSWNALSPDPGTSWVPYRVYNIGNHISVPLLEFIAVIEKAVGRKAILDFKPMQLGDVKETFADIEDIQRDIGYSPKTPIQEGIPKFVDWYLDYYEHLNRKPSSHGELACSA